MHYVPTSVTTYTYYSIDTSHTCEAPPENESIATPPLGGTTSSDVEPPFRAKTPLVSMASLLVVLPSVCMDTRSIDAPPTHNHIIHPSIATIATLFSCSTHNLSCHRDPPISHPLFPLLHVDGCTSTPDVSWYQKVELDSWHGGCIGSRLPQHLCFFMNFPKSKVVLLPRLVPERPTWQCNPILNVGSTILRPSRTPRGHLALPPSEK